MDLKPIRKAFGLTQTEADILSHRLEVPDAIADALSELHPTGPVYMVADCLVKGEFDDAMRDYGVEITNDVLAECIEGGTYVATAVDQSPQKRAGIQRAADSLAAKISKLIGRKVQYPTG